MILINDDFSPGISLNQRDGQIRTEKPTNPTAGTDAAIKTSPGLGKNLFIT
jgi:hypothetical protein